MQMLGSFNSMFSKLKSVNIVSAVTENYNKLKDKVMNKLAITQIIPQLFHIDYPQENNVEQLVQHITFSPYQIWNISEYRYQDRFETAMKEKAPFGEIHYLYYEYYSNIPFYELVHAIGKIQQFISANPSHHVYVHCQDSKVRSAVFLSAYIFKTGAVQVQDISEAILYVNKCLQMQLQDNKQGISSSYKNHHRLFKNVMNYHNNPQFINPWRLKLQKIIITNAPRIKIQEENQKKSGISQLKVVIEVRNQESVLFKGNFPEAVIEGDCIGINFQQHGKHLVISDEFLLVIKYSWNKKIYSILRIQLNTNFIFQLFARIQQQDIDLSVHCALDPERTTFVDLMFQEQTQKSKLALLTEKAAELRKKKQLRKQENIDLLSGEGVPNIEQKILPNILKIQQTIIMPIIEPIKVEIEPFIVPNQQTKIEQRIVTQLPLPLPFDIFDTKVEPLIVPTQEIKIEQAVAPQLLLHFDVKVQLKPLIVPPKEAVLPQSPSSFDTKVEQPNKLNEKGLPLKIEQVMTSMTIRQDQHTDDDKQEQEQDLDDYFSRLQSQV